MPAPLSRGIYSTSFTWLGLYNSKPAAGASCLFIQFAKRVLQLGTPNERRWGNNEQLKVQIVFYYYDFHLQIDFK